MLVECEVGKMVLEWAENSETVILLINLDSCLC